MRRLIAVKIGLIFCLLVLCCLNLPVFSSAEIFQEAPNPVVTWTKTYGSPGLDQGSAVRQTSDGGYIVVGGTTGYGIEPEGWHSEGWVLKLDAKGGIQWQKTYGFGNNTEDFIYSVLETSDNGYLLGGSRWYANLGYSDAWVVRIDSQGNVIWDKVFSAAVPYYGGFIRSMHQTANGDFAALGGAFKVYGYGYTDAWIIKFDENGSVKWSKAYPSNVASSLSSFSPTEDGGYIAAGGVFTELWRATSDAWIMKLDADGNIIWQKLYDIGMFDGFRSVREIGDGYIAGGVGGDQQKPWLAKLDTEGNVQWQGTYASGGIYSIQPAPGGGYIVADFPHIMKFSADNRVEWEKTYEGRWSGKNTDSSIAQTSDGGYVVAGGGGEFQTADIQIFKLDSGGNIYGCAGQSISDSEINSTFSSGNVTVREGGGGMAATNTQANDVNAVVSNSSAAAAPRCVESAPDIAVSPASVDFGPVTVSGSFVRTVTIANRVDANLIIASVTITGADASEFSQSNNCLTLGGYSACPVEVMFTPSSIGQKNAVLTISSNDPDSPTMTVILSGTGIDVQLPDVSIIASPSILWPPNHKMVDVLIGGTASDSGSGIASVEIMVADEYGVYNMTAPGFGSTIQLEAWREGTDMDGRYYTITAAVTDKAGNRSTSTTEVLVPHDMR